MCLWIFWRGECVCLCLCVGWCANVKRVYILSISMRVLWMCIVDDYFVMVRWMSVCVCAPLLSLVHLFQHWNLTLLSLIISVGYVNWLNHSNSNCASTVCAHTSLHFHPEFHSLCVAICTHIFRSNNNNKRERARERESEDLPFAIWDYFGSDWIGEK